MLSNNNALEVLTKEKADERLEQIAFLDSWRELYETCPWATGYQSREYCVTWYHVFSEKFSPILLLAYDDQKQLVGLFALARSRHTNEIVIAGNQHPEYRVWLARPDHHSVFAKHILKWLKQHCPNPLDFCYLPHSLPLDWLNKHCVIYPD